jgi:hypothetical protein
MPTKFSVMNSQEEAMTPVGLTQDLALVIFLTLFSVAVVNADRDLVRNAVKMRCFELN